MIRHTGTPRHYGRLVAILLGAALLTGALAAEAKAHVLTFTAARSTAQARANAYAHQPTRIRTMLRQGLHAYYVQADWTSVDPRGCKGCGVDGAGNLIDTPLSEYHAIALRVTCIGPHTRLNARWVCARRAYVTDVFG